MSATAGGATAGGAPIDPNTPAGGVRLAQRRQALPNGWWGMALFLCAEVTLFGTLIGSYFYLAFGVHHWPPLGIAPEKVLAPSIATAALVATTVPMWLAARAACGGRRRTVAWMIALAFVVQAAYFAAQVVLLGHDLEHFGPQGTAYGSIYYTLLGAHHAHVLFGCLFSLVVLWFVLRRGLTNYWLTATRCLALYWYVVNALAVIVLLTQLSPSL